MNWSRKKFAIGVSVAFHLVLLVVLVLWYVPRSSPTSGSDSAPTPDTVSSTGPSKSVEEAESTPEPAQVPSEQISDSVQAKIDDANKLTDEQKLSELDKNLRRLESVATAESVTEVSETIAGTLGLDTTTYADKEAPQGDGKFDIDSAQIKDVIRSRTESGGWSYESLMVDANGRTQRVPLTAAEGESLYDTFQRLKQFPMARGIYQGVVMPMMQQMIEKAEQLEKQATEIQNSGVENSDQTKLESN